jgi:hypothetical protein
LAELRKGRERGKGEGGREREIKGEGRWRERKMGRTDDY